MWRKYEFSSSLNLNGERDLTHKRSRVKRRLRLERQQDYHAIKELRRQERTRIWDRAFYDHIVDEVVNRIICDWNPIHQGEVLVDSRNRGFFQRIPT